MKTRRIITCLSLALLCAMPLLAQGQGKRAYGAGNPFTTEELPEGSLKAKLKKLKPQARAEALKRLHSFSFPETDAAKHLKVDDNGGIFIVCPIEGCGHDCENHGHDHEHAESAPDSADQAAEGVLQESIPIGDGTNETFNPSSPVPVSAPPVFHSKPGAPFHIYLDFNGAYVTGKQWDYTDGTTTWDTWDCDAWSTDTDRTTFSASEQNDIRRMWERVAEDYAPFDVNVTTDAAYDPDNYTGDKNKVGWLLTTPTTDKNGVRCPHYGYGGVAYVNVFGRSDFFSRYQPAWVTPMGTANTAEAASHEMGHNMGLSHDGLTTGAAYYGGHAATTSSPSWGPIMGTGYGRNVSQWSKASEYFNGNQAQDDLSIIAGKVTYRADDHGDTFPSATAWTESPVNQPGVVENTGDSDVFTFSTGAGPVSFSANTYRCDTQTWGGNLDAVLELYDSTQTLVASGNPLADTNASISTSVPAGTYYLVLKPTGTATPLASPPSGYTDYGSLGHYSITGTYSPTDSIFVTAPGGGESWLIGASNEITWASGAGGNVSIELLKGGSLDSTISSSTPNDGSFIWDIPSAQAQGDDYKIRITSLSNPSITAASVSDFSIVADLLAASLDTTGINWTTSGDATWFPQTTTTSDGIDAAQSGVITDNQNSSLSTTLTGPGTLNFRWKVSSEQGWDYLRFFLNGVEQTGSLARISGEVDWIEKTVTIPSGNNTVEWRYTKDGSVDGGTDAGWLDQVAFAPDNAPEIVVEQPSGNDLVDGSATIDFGPVNTGSSSSAVTFTIRNTGNQDLTGLALSKSGPNSADYTLGSLGATTLAPAASTTFTVTFSPGEAGTRTAAIQIASNDADENPFDINLTGTGLGPGTLVVSTADDLNSSGFYGGPFSPTAQQYTLSNPGSTSIDWTASKAAGWLTLDSTGGTLAPGANTTVTATIDGSTLDVGGYADTVTFTNTTNGGGDSTRDVTLTVNPLSATVQLADLSQTYDGSPKPVSVITTPSGLAHEVTYDGSPSAPTGAGTYAVVATVTEPNYAGSASGNLAIAKAAQTITFPAFAEPIGADTAPFGIAASIDSALDIVYTSSDISVATVSGSTLTVVGPGTATITASQPGDANHEPASSVQRELTVFQTNLAEAVVYEPFDDGDATLTGNAVGKGLTGTWSGNGNVVANSLDYGNLPAGTGSTASVSNQNGYVSTGTTLANTGLLDDGADLWFSVLVRTGSDIATNGDLGFALGTDQLNSGNNLPISNGGQALGFTFKNNQLRASHWAPTLDRSSTNTGNGANPESLYLVVGKITWGASSETIEIYRPATNLVLGDTVSTYSTAANLDQSQFDTISFSSKSATPAHLFDEIRFGASYESVIGLGGSVDRFSISPISSPQTVGNPITGITITAMTAADETATSFTGTVTFGGTAGVTGTSANFIDGVLSGLSVIPTVAGSDLTLTVDDGESHTGSATIASVPSVYESWAGTNELTGGDAGPDTSVDGDSLTNLQEFAFGTDPKVENFNPLGFVMGGDITTPGVPTVINLAQPGQPDDERAVFARLKNHAAAGLTYTVEFSADLELWTASGAVPTVLTDPNSAGDYEAVSVPFSAAVPVAAGGTPRAPKFMRVVVSSGS